MTNPQADVQDVIKEAERLLAGITPGEWFISEADGSIRAAAASSIDDSEVAEVANPGDDEFIAAAPRLVRQLLAALSSPPSSANEKEQETRVDEGQPQACPPAGSTAASNEPDPTCEHGVAWDVHCCGCHSGFLFDSRKCVCF